MHCNRRHFTAALGAGVLGTAAPWAQAQSFPERSIRVTVPFSAGSGPDTVLRAVAESVQSAGRGQFLIDNKPGANGWLAADTVKRAPADGYALLQVEGAQMTLQQHLYKQMPYDGARDFVPVAALYSTNFFIVVPANARWNSVQELLADARAKPGALSYGTWGVGSIAHLGAAMFEERTGTSMMHVPFKEIPQLYSAVASGDVSWAFGTAATVGPLYKGKKVKLLALAGPKRLDGYTEVPTVAEAGGPADFELRSWIALFGPKGMPAAAVAHINGAVNQALATPAMQARLAAFGFEAWRAEPAAITAAIERESAVFAQVVKKARITVD
jgi:tripartite-type tricarboxylate transporter receptor subunit TctC